MAKATDYLQNAKGKRITLVYELDHWDMSPDGVRFRRDDFTRQGVLKDIYDDQWILFNAALVNLKFVKEIRFEP